MCLVAPDHTHECRPLPTVFLLLVSGRVLSEVYVARRSITMDESEYCLAR
jgi:hypothetical protein